jgi:hypothetical protein
MSRRTLIRCDRCGQSEEHSTFGSPGPTIAITETNEGSSITRLIDLCELCRDHFTLFMHQEPDHFPRRDESGKRNVKP